MHLPVPARVGQASVLVGTRRARPNVASPAAQTWPAGRYVRPLAYGSSFPAGGAAGRHRGPAGVAWPHRTVSGVDDVLGVTEQWGSRNSPLESWGCVGRGGRSQCSAAVTVLVTRSWQAAERHTLGNQCSWFSTPRDTALGATAGGTEPTHVAVPTPSVQRHSSPAVGWGSWSWNAAGGDLQGEVLSPEQRIPTKVGTGGQG